ncbi:Glucosidase 2 subunit beta [Hondaea fermentalgiana]|uniref:Glucosidase 2 subunit beta n=1 Tax=Hondaea fermentalgiana TaxID=2315210 RepID=A0A2R5GFA3_9STRA|nr:Glucosidase 2 subunit beta [Hondaea fermentalgiana]|eukprot:GBG29616.1 Glucosidase 2 subunit beta [Hondaea fermentalgiana]
MRARLLAAAAFAAAAAPAAQGGWLFGGGSAAADVELSAEDVGKLAALEEELGAGGDDFGGRSEIRGVPERDADKYAGLRFSCDGGSRELAVEAVNDDFCDCNDGSDEPGTSACSMVNLASFFCANEGYKGLVLPTARVFDGICDCCDGSDEAPGKCPDTCQEDGASYRADMARLSKVREAGLAKKAEYIAQAQGIDEEMSETDERLKELARDLKGTQTELDEAQALVSRLEEEAAAARKLLQRKLRAKRVAALHLDTFTREQLELLLVDVVVEGGTPETLVTLVQEALDDPLTPRAAEVAVDGSIDPDAATARTAEWIYENDAQEVDLDLEDHYADAYAETLDDEDEDEDEGEGEGEGENDEDVDVEDLTNAKDAGRETDSTFSLETAKSRVRELERNVRRLEKEESKLKEKAPQDYGSQNQWYAIRDKCFSSTADKYKYEICMYKQAKQDKVNLGEWSGFLEGSNDRTFKFTKGQRCWNGPERSLTVHATCGPEERIIDVREPSTCEYVMTFTSPAAC